MKKTLLLFLFIMLTFSSSAQNWTEPVNVSNMNDFILSSDFTIDHSGIIHCVWSLKYDANFSVIYYSKSDDNGFTWSDPLSISQNEDLYCTGPQIVNDTDNKIYVAYDLYDFSPVTWGVYATIVINDGTGWNEPLQLAEGLTTRLAIDNNDRLYVFWYQGAPHNGEFCYKYLENELWSEIFIPFDNLEKTSVHSIIADANNNLHCGGYYDPTSFSNVHPAYFRFDFNTQQWDSITILSQNTTTSDIDIALGPDQQPHICWSEHDTYYSTFNGQYWTVADTVGRPSSVRVEIDVDEADKVHITVTEGFNNVGNLVYYHRPDGMNWDSTIVTQAGNTIFTPEFEIYNNTLYLVYKSSDQPGYGDVYLTRLDDLVSTGEAHSINFFSPVLKQNIPNPFKANTTIEFNIKECGVVKLNIVNSIGQNLVILVDDYLSSGDHSIRWNGETNNGNKVLPGLYFYCLQVNEIHYTKKMLYQP